MHVTTRRLLLATGATTAVTALAGCTGSSRDIPVVGSIFGDSEPRAGRGRQPNYEEIYTSYPGEQHPIPAFHYSSVDPLFLRQEVDLATREPPGSIVVDPSKRFLYLVEQSGRATRYGVGVGREGFAWAGTAHINLRRAWPDWIPPREMVGRDPEIRLQLVHTPRGEGVPGGPANPLGARAMYLFAGGRDLGYRIHGTTEPETIGTAVSSGCIRMVNQDVIHLYGRAAAGTSVTVLANTEPNRPDLKTRQR